MPSDSILSFQVSLAHFVHRVLSKLAGSAQEALQVVPGGETGLYGLMKKAEKEVR